MAFNTGKLIEGWGKTDKRIEAHNKRRKWIIIGLAVVVFLLIVYFILNNIMGMVFRPVTSLASVPQAQDWAMFARDPLHSAGLNPAASVLQGKVSTILSTKAEIGSSPVVADGTVYIGSRDHYLYAVDAATGALRWKFETGSWVESSPAVVNKVVYAGSNDGKMYALAADTGEKIWEYSTKFVIRSSPAVAGGKVYFGCNDYAIHALNAENGKQVWQVNTNSDVQSSPVIDNGILYVGAGAEYFFAVDARNGRVRNQFNTFKPVVSSPAVQDGVVYLCSTEGTLYAMDGKACNWIMENKIRPMWAVLYIYGGAPRPPPPSGYLWSLPLGGSSISSPAIAGNNLYIGAGKKLVSIDIQTHSKRWENLTGGTVSSTPLVVGNVVYVTSENGHLYAFDTARGEQLKDITIGGKITTNPVMSGSTIYVSSSDGNLYAVN